MDTSRSLTIDLLCPYGQIETIADFGLAKLDGSSVCPKDQFDLLNLESNCNILSMGQNVTNYIKKNFEMQCFGATACRLNINTGFFSNDCLSEIKSRQQTNSSAQLFVQGLCQDADIEIPYSSYTLKRTTLGIIVVSLDVAIIVSLLLSFSILGHYENLDNQEINKKMLMTEDFAIVVRDLPDHNEFSNLKELKALLWNHLERVISEEPQVIKQF